MERLKAKMQRTVLPPEDGSRCNEAHIERDASTLPKGEQPAKPRGDEMKDWAHARSPSPAQHSSKRIPSTRGNDTAIVSTPPQTTPASPLLNLPTDVLHHLLTFLPYNSLLALRLTHRSTRHLLHPSYLAHLRRLHVARSLATEATLLQNHRLSRSPAHNHLRRATSQLWTVFYAAFEWQLRERPARHLPCYGCLQVKPLSAFVERMSSRGLGLGGTRAADRRCKDCMRREEMGMRVAGWWWREHWVRSADVRRRKGAGAGKGKGMLRLLGKGAPAVANGHGRVEEEEAEVGVCTVCGTSQFELFWGCAGCFDKEEQRKRDEWYVVLGWTRDEREHMRGGWMHWLLERVDGHQSRKEKRRRRRYARRAERGGKRWGLRRLLAWATGDSSRHVSWAERVEALVDFLQSDGDVHDPSWSDDANADADAVVVDVKDHRNRTDEKTANDAKRDLMGVAAAQTKKHWRPEHQMPRKNDRWETRCSMCWVPTSSPRYALGLAACERRLSIDKCCEDCQEEDLRKMQRRKGLDHLLMRERAEEDALEYLRELFVP
ncbi:uncharacterized protein HMPREF1541_04729 [Cyphellophora europaea CBS 101466]|uniref:F-box domain-containing protein n=1 Tax=Cyphellophora europaea (strain CBS 101466) TaxID=1220924 RepID=W2RVJ4_CYPE1|nr:uncharacterized protein HMPREF1541_04729 [Cyphellophora europaea CBS 101466]ETN40452.1 hypothetical protein HMPREF1541_04729 [Cyphellophora europaea CBS 101466]